MYPCAGRRYSARPRRRRHFVGFFENLFRAGKKGDRPAIEITNINLERKNSWDNPQIQLWLANPVGFGKR